MNFISILFYEVIDYFLFNLNKRKKLIIFLKYLLINEYL